jgi:hypothetical protein
VPGVLGCERAGVGRVELLVHRLEALGDGPNGEVERGKDRIESLGVEVCQPDAQPPDSSVATARWASAARSTRPQVNVLRSVRPLGEEDVVTRTRRARYGAGSVRGRDIPAYVQVTSLTEAPCGAARWPAPRAACPRVEPLVATRTPPARGGTTSVQTTVV